MNWSRFKSHFYHNEDLGVSLDVSRIAFPDEFLATMGAKMQQAFADMAALEKGAIANPDEKRMVGHYWLRAPQLAPTPELTAEISSTFAAMPCSSANCLTGEACSFMPRPAGRSGWVRTRGSVKPAACSLSSATRANSGVPAKTTLNARPRVGP